MKKRYAPYSITAMQRTLTELTAGVPILERAGPADRPITGISYDSRAVAPGHLFLACDGLHTDGHRFIPQAIERGAAAIVHSRPTAPHRPGVTYLRVENPRFWIAPIAAAFFGHPSRDMRVVGVTGTNGKSTTACYVTQLLEHLGYRAGLLSTTFIKTADEYCPNPFRASTPEGPELQHALRRMVDVGNEFAVVEATSHGLATRNNRVGGIDFDVAVLTNLSHEHLEFHGSIEQYRDDKANLFRRLDESTWQDAFGVINADSPHGSYFAGVTRRRTYGYSVTGPVDLYASRIRSRLEETIFTVHSRLSVEGKDEQEEYRDIRLRAPGAFNVENVLAALLTAARLTGAPLRSLIEGVPGLSGVPGRMQRIDSGQPFLVFVDFAHSPDAFSRMLPLASEETRGRLIVVFGSAGDRDREKRAVQGSIADRYADVIVLTDEDPRTEDRLAVLEEIASGCTKHRRGDDLFLIPDRHEAIRHACGGAEAGDTVLLLGKGHERSIEYSDRSEEWNEAKVATEVLGELGYQ